MNTRRVEMREEDMKGKEMKLQDTGGKKWDKMRQK